MSTAIRVTTPIYSVVDFLAINSIRRV